MMVNLPSSMHVTQLGYGGAWMAASRIRSAIESVGGTAHIEHEIPRNERKSISPTSLFAKIDYEIQALGKTSTTISSGRSLGNSRWITQIDKSNEEIDIWNLHWMPGMPNKSLQSLIRRKRVVWTLHDMNPFTGVCHWAQDCENFRNECTSCPQFPKILGINLLPNLILERKIEMVQNSRNLVLVTPSNWMRQQFSKSQLSSHVEARHIPNPIPGIFITKHHFDVTNHLTITILGQDYDKSKNSCMSAIALLKFIRENSSHNIRIQVIGEPHDVLKSYSQVCLSSNSSQEDLSKFLQESNIFVYTSKYDNLPSLVLEAQATGNAVVALDNGGVSECLLPDKSGILASLSIQSLVQSISELTSNENLLREMSFLGAKYVEANFSEAIIGKKYLDLYEELTLKN
jgi:glycosyltransferase involved in cell wall biosynthesis